MFANISLALTFFVYLALLQFGTQKPPGGDYGVGHAWASVFLGGALFLTSLMALVALASNGGFAWAPGQGWGRTLLLGLGWATFCIATLICTSYHSGTEALPFWLEWVLRSGGRIWWPLLTLVPAFLLANPSIGAGKNPAAFQIAMKIVFFLNLFFCLGLYLEMRRVNARHYASSIQRDDQAPDWEERNRVSWIKDSTASRLWYASHSNKPGVMRSAFVKVTSGENWQSELLRVLHLKHHYWELYAFVALHSTELPPGFDEVLEGSIRRLAGQIRTNDPHEGFQKSMEHDRLNICQLVKALDERFFDSEVDFLPAMLALQSALEANAPTPEFWKEEREAVGGWIQGRDGVR